MAVQEKRLQEFIVYACAILQGSCRGFKKSHAKRQRQGIAAVFRIQAVRNLAKMYINARTEFAVAALVQPDIPLSIRPKTNRTIRAEQTKGLYPLRCSNMHSSCIIAYKKIAFAYQIK